ncbi:MAG: hypothetical protein H0T76_26495 [Nannocystis sp.]|nr:MYXO-CTERM sorting domain-containing protein [Nannocystis sp.]MBA3550044.1 hypothetical protein [Nannocystis sp.]
MTRCLAVRRAPLLAGLATVVALTLGGSSPVRACKPPPYFAEHLEFRLTNANGSTLAPPRLRASTVDPESMQIDGLGRYLRLTERAADMTPAMQRYIRRQSRLGRVMCFSAWISRAPAIPGTYAQDAGRDDQWDIEAPWDQVWPKGTPGLMVLDPTRKTLTLRIGGGENPVELEYTLTQASYSQCSVAPDAGAPGLLALTLLGLRRRRRRHAPHASRSADA